MGKSKIEWTNETWNPIVGCSIVSHGCTNCYAMKMAARIEKMSGHPMAQHVKVQTHYAGTTQPSKAGAVWTGKVARAPDHILTAPLRWKRGRKVFVNSMGDLFHESIPDEWIDKVFAVMALSPQHPFQVLTKRADRMRRYLNADYLTERIIEHVGRLDLSGATGHGIPNGLFGVYEDGSNDGTVAFARWPLPNVWLGVSTERQQEADERIPLLLQTPAAVRFISAEPLLGPIDLTFIRHLKKPPAHIPNAHINALNGYIDNGTRTNLDWIIVGGESGPNARPMHPQWARDLRDQCAEAGVPFFFKQWGEYLPVGQSLPGYGTIHGASQSRPGRMKLHYGGTPQQAPEHAFAERGVAFASLADGRLTFRVGKKAAGRLLDGKEHSEFPTSNVRVNAA